MTIETKLFLLSTMKSIIDNSLEHDCRNTDPESGGCTFCYKAQQAISELNKI